MANPYGMTFKELFPQLIAPAALGVVSSYSRPAARGVEMGLRSADMFSLLKERGVERKLQQQASEAMTGAIGRQRGALEKERDEYIDARSDADLKASFLETGLLKPEGATLPTSKPDDATPTFHDFFKTPAYGDVVQSHVDFPGGGPGHDLSIDAAMMREAQHMGAGLAEQGVEDMPLGEIGDEFAGLKQEAMGDVDTTRIDDRLNFLDIQAAHALSSPAAAGNILGWSSYQREGAMQEQDRLDQLYRNSLGTIRERAEWDLTIDQANAGHTEAKQLRDLAHKKILMTSPVGEYGYVGFNEAGEKVLYGTRDPRRRPGKEEVDIADLDSDAVMMKIVDISKKISSMGDYSFTEKTMAREAAVPYLLRAIELGAMPPDAVERWLSGEGSVKPEAPGDLPDKVRGILGG